jgi:hypothetical protein
MMSVTDPSPSEDKLIHDSVIMGPEFGNIA